MDLTLALHKPQQRQARQCSGLYSIAVTDNLTSPAYFRSEYSIRFLDIC